MKDINQLQIKKLFKELDFYETDYEYKNEVITQSESEFMNSVNEFLDGDPELKQLFDEKLNQRFEDAVNKSIQEEEEIDYDVIDEKPTPSPKIKKLYREIVKNTHPDKIKSKKLNDIYIKAAKHYEDNEILQIYKICDDLGIEYELEISDNKIVADKIEYYKDKITLLQSSFTWKWSSSDDQNKIDIIKNYIKKMIT
jgi:hypothetical protein